jgi:ribonuclease D
LSAPAPRFVADPAALEEVGRRLAEEPVLAIDTEGNSFHVFFERVCLIQIGVPGLELVLDPFAVDVKPLAPLFADPQRLLVFHGGDFDIRSLRRDFGFTFGRVFDTMIASQVLALPELGLAALLKSRLGVEIAKGEQRSDWGKRPLRPEQLRYAATDVRHLLALWDGLEKELVAAGKRDEAEKKFQKLRQVVARERVFDPEGWRKMRQARSLDPEGAALLRALWVGREELARALDKPPFKVVGEQSMLEIARRHPRSLDELRKVPGVSDLLVRRLGEAVLAAGKSALAEKP